MSKFLYLLLFTMVFSILGLVLKNILGLHDFGAVFWFFFALGEGLGLFDLVVIDLLWWRSNYRNDVIDQSLFIKLGEEMV